MSKPELPKGWKPPFSIEVSMHDGRFYLRDADGNSLEYDSDHDGNTLVLCGNPKAMEAIAFALNQVCYDQALDNLQKRNVQLSKEKHDHETGCVLGTRRQIKPLCRRFDSCPVYFFFRSQAMCNNKCGWCVLCKYDEAKERQYPSWTKADAVNEMGCYWHWDGDMGCSPEIVYIQYSGSRGVYFASIGQLGWTEAQDVLDMGGWWKRVPHPTNEELRKILESEVTS